MNALAGRVWCGYLCPQTVWTDLFFAVERWTEGDRRERMLERQAAHRSIVRAKGAEALPLADDRVVDRRRLGALFRRCADAGEELATFQAPLIAYALDRHPHIHDLLLRRPSCASRSASICAHGRAFRRR